MEKVLKSLVEKQFQVYSWDQPERTTNFLGLMKLLSSHSDFFRYTDTEQREYIIKSAKQKSFRIDANIEVKYH